MASYLTRDWKTTPTSSKSSTPLNPSPPTPCDYETHGLRNAVTAIWTEAPEATRHSHRLHISFPMSTGDAPQYSQQKLCSWFEVNTKFPSTTPIAYMINFVRTLLYLILILTVTYLILHCTVAECTSRVNIILLSAFMIQ